MENISKKPYILATLNDCHTNEPIVFSTRNYSKGKITPIHWHNFLELEIIKEGSVRHIVSDNSYNLKKGSAYIMNDCDFHSLVFESDSTILNLSIMRGIIDDKLEKFILSGGGKLNCNFDSEQLDYVTALFKLAQKETETEPFSKLIKKNIAEELLILLIRASGIDEVVPNPPLIQKAIAIVNNRFLNHLTLKKVAEELYVSPNYLGLLFKNNVGISFNTYLTMTRLKYACILLNSTNKTVKEIASDSGFDSTEYFLSRFKKFMKCTPSEYRNFPKQ